MKRMLMAIMAVAMLVAFTAPSFASGEGDKGKKEEKKKGHVVVYGTEDGKKKEEKKKDKGH